MFQSVKLIFRYITIRHCLFNILCNKSYVHFLVIFYEPIFHRLQQLKKSLKPIIL